MPRIEFRGQCIPNDTKVFDPPQIDYKEGSEACLAF